MGWPFRDPVFLFGLPSDKPVAGDWNGSGTSKLGVNRDGAWVLDLNGNARWDGALVDEIVSGFTRR